MTSVPPSPLPDLVDATNAQAGVRLAGLDAARVLATFGIVWVHVAESQGLSPEWVAPGRFGTSFYVIVAALFVVRNSLGDTRQSLFQQTIKRVRRLLLPFVLWSLVYGAYYGYHAYHQGTAFGDLARWWGPAAGTAIHLWFLPFVFVWGVVASILVPQLCRLSRRTLLLTGVIATASIYYYCYRHLFFSLNRETLWAFHLHRVDRWIEEVPPFFATVFGGLYFYRIRQETRERLKKHLPLIAALSLVGFFAFQALYVTQLSLIYKVIQTEGRFFANVIALCLLIGFSASDRSKLVELLAPPGRSTYIAFLAHMLVLELLRDTARLFAGYGTPWFCMIWALVIFTLSVGLARVTARHRIFAWLRA